MLLHTPKKVYFQHIPYRETLSPLGDVNTQQLPGVPRPTPLLCFREPAVVSKDVFLASQSPKYMKSFPLSTWDTSPNTGNLFSLPLFPSQGQLISSLVHT